MPEKMKCIIVDDEPLARKGVAMLVQKISFLEPVAEFSNVIKAYEFMQDSPVDLILLDIEMPGLSGLDFLRSLPQKCLVILTTAYPQFALEAYELDVLDYLVKPIKLDRFLKSIHKAHEIFQLKSKSHEFEEARDEYIFIRSDRKFVKLYYRDILFIKGLKDYVVIYCNQNKFITSLNMKSFGAQLPDKYFVRVSKSYIINVDKVESIETGHIRIGEEKIPLGKTYKEDFIQNYVNTRLIKREA
jgi:DNA-binding LytR/AlgR family response regulator